MFVNVAAKPGIGIDELLEAVLLTADASLELTAPIDGPAQGVAIEAHLDKGRGAVATVLVQKGTLRAGDSIVAGGAHGRVRAMLDENGNQVAEAGPARPVLVLGLTAVPGAGDTFLAADGRPHGAADRRAAAGPPAGGAASPTRRGRATLETLMEQLKEGEKTSLTLVLKGDVSGSVEALEDALFKIDIPDEVQLKDHPPRRRCDHRERRQPGERVVRRDATIIGFNVRAANKVRRCRPRGRGDPVLHASSTRPSRRSRRRSRACSSRSTRRSSWARGDPRGLPLVQDRHHRRLHRPVGHHPPQRQGAAAARRARWWRTTSRSARSSGSRTTPPRSARASSVV